ncbi:hypothetical protein, partial [Helicobacter sp. 12S02634-8]|uniref:hypothetical protein n=1 Tax=Helicobacter sp. 12S02634-8 TaxID=1476199 RepID=UPI001C0F204C
EAGDFINDNTDTILRYIDMTIEASKHIALFATAFILAKPAILFVSFQKKGGVSSPTPSLTPKKLFWIAKSFCLRIKGLKGAELKALHLLNPLKNPFTPARKGEIQKCKDRKPRIAVYSLALAWCKKADLRLQKCSRWLFASKEVASFPSLFAEKKSFFGVKEGVGVDKPLF